MQNGGNIRQPAKFATGLHPSGLIFVAESNKRRKMSCTCCSHDHGHTAARHGQKDFIKEYGRIIGSGLLLAAGALFRSPVCYLAAYLPVALPVLKEAREGLARREYFNEFTLMLIATLGAFAIGEYPEAVAVMLFYSVGEHLQERAVGKARRNIRALLDLRPEKAVVLRDGQALSISPQEVQTGEVIEVKAGGRVPLDGTLCNADASFNTAALTGESLPRRIKKGGEVPAGLIAVERTVRLRVIRSFAESALSRILRMVQEASERKAPAELFIRRFARIYTPVVTGLAVLIVLLPWLWSLCSGRFDYGFGDWLYRALVFLVVSCPCALVIGIPLSYFGGIGAASRRGILFKGGNYLDAIAHIDTVVFDKTGTLTRGEFDVQVCVPRPGISEEDLIRLAASAEQESTHPLAAALMRHVQARHISLLPVSEVEELAGFGIRATLDGRKISVGNIRLLEREGIACPPELREAEGTIVACTDEGRYIGFLILADTLKEDARQAIDGLKELNIKNIQILSGDKQSIVTTFARRLHIGQAYGDLLPEDKVKHIENLRLNGDSRIAFVGDGINDAPALALSNVGIAMGRWGSDAAIETADVVIQTDRPSRILTAIWAGRHTRRIVRQNILLALGVKIAVLALGAVGMATLWEAVFADVGVALLAVLNAMRIQKLIK